MDTTKTSEGYLEGWGSQRCAREGEGHAATPVYATSWAEQFIVHMFVLFFDCGVAKE